MPNPMARDESGQPICFLCGGEHRSGDDPGPPGTERTDRRRRITR